MAALFDTVFENKKTSHEIHISHLEKQLHKGQDYITSGDNFIWGFDGHANNYIIDNIRGLNLNHFIDDIDPILSLANYLNENAKVPNHITSGSTSFLVKKTDDEISLEWVGDSQIAVFEKTQNSADYKMTFMSEPDKWDKPFEKERLTTMNSQIYASPSKDIKIVSPDTIEMIDTYYINFPSGLQLATSQALGHNGQTGCVPNKKIISIIEGTTYRVVSGSDGFWQLVLTDNIDDFKILTTKPCEELLELSVNRWNSNDWKCYINGPDNEPTIAGFGNCKDDVCVGIMDIISI
uniref:PPM-type phosphatase domain-containing protein n=1 Tax=viral metagenome TaxID=1070528 RepID=A0A6C0DL72_9ZZZZ